MPTGTYALCKSDVAWHKIKRLAPVEEENCKDATDQERWRRPRHRLRDLYAQERSKDNVRARGLRREDCCVLRGGHPSCYVYLDSSYSRVYYLEEREIKTVYCQAKGRLSVSQFEEQCLWCTVARRGHRSVAVCTVAVCRHTKDLSVTRYPIRRRWWWGNPSEGRAA